MRTKLTSYVLGSHKLKVIGLAFILILTMTGPAAAISITVSIENLAPPNGTFITPLFIGFHNGSFDIYDLGASASPGLERVAEDGILAPLMTQFVSSGAGLVTGAIMGSIPPFGIIPPGETDTRTFTLDENLPSSRFFSYAAMIVPSNDAFIANDNPTALPIFDSIGNFLGASFIVAGSMVRDAGTEVNDEIPMNTAFFGQMTPDTGVTEGGVIHTHPGFNPPGSGGILDDPMFANADFTVPGYQIARITISPVPEPSTILLLGTGFLGLLAYSYRHRINTKEHCNDKPGLYAGNCPRRHHGLRADEDARQCFRT